MRASGDTIFFVRWLRKEMQGLDLRSVAPPPEVGNQ